MQNIQSLSRILYGLFIILFWATPLVYAFYWLEPSHTLANSIGWQLAGMANPALPALNQLSFPVCLIGWVVSWVPMLADLFTWYFLIKLFGAYRHGHIFTPRNAKYIRNIGITLLTWEVATLPYQLLLTFVMTSQQPPGHHFIALSYSNYDLANVLAAIVIIVVGWIMQRGAQLAEEQALTV